MLKGKSTLVVSILLAISFCANLVLVGCLFYQPDSSVVGTYLAGDEKLPSATYFVFSSDDTYVIYRQFELLEKGGYSTDDGSVYALKAEGQSGEQFAVFNGSDLLHYFDAKGGAVTFGKISDTPAFINLEGFER